MTKLKLGAGYYPRKIVILNEVKHLAFERKQHRTMFAAQILRLRLRMTCAAGFALPD